MISRAFVVAGLGFGDEGKGSIVDWLVRTEVARLVVRYNGGPQAAHHVVAADGRVHCFAQFGAGSLVPGTRTHLSRFMLVDPLALAKEAEALATLGEIEPFSRLSADPRCVVVTPFHALLNRLQEACRGDARHGSCGRGVGQAQLDAERGGLPVVRLEDLASPSLRRTLRLLWQVKVDQAEQLADGRDEPEVREFLQDLRRPDRVDALVEAYRSLPLTLREELPDAEVAVFEGAQGVLLDRHHGFWPHVTPSVTTFDNARALLPATELVRVGVLRALHTRHGAGPMPTEDAELTKIRPDSHNRLDRWQGSFRVGWFDGALARYALEACGGVDLLALTNVDRLEGLPRLRVATGYETPLPKADPNDFAARDALTAALRAAVPVYRDIPLDSYLDELEPILGRPVDLVSRGPTAGDKQRRMRAR